MDATAVSLLIGGAQFLLTLLGMAVGAILTYMKMVGTLRDELAKARQDMSDRLAAFDKAISRELADLRAEIGRLKDKMEDGEGEFAKLRKEIESLQERMRDLEDFKLRRESRPTGVVSP